MNVTTQNKQGRSMVDLQSFDYVEKRRIFIFESITDETAQRFITELNYLEALSHIYIVLLYATVIMIGAILLFLRQAKKQ